MNCFPGQIFLYIFQCHDVYQQFTAIFVFIKGIEGVEDFIISGCLFSILFIFSFRNIHVLMQNYKKLFDFYYRKDKKFVVVN